MNTLFGRYQVAPIFYAGLVWVLIGLFGKHHTAFLILGLLFMAMGLKRVEQPPQEPPQPESPADQ
ncbi:hypothetical protein MUN84_19300 [Hymenobacter sp. 5516J-16]|uniref:hypothetical protein n=1 Tax=Hymenobacter sp. 5516J-16 TaxID=2932253 RepID=UPI001FD5DDF8|nr:hypothetical protein [Hymenobacter sp. 5516J-16]UOQ76648.1 hypothetical protein MUN84_19300 [Hymenobacter sp. 5516J-16]